MIEQVFQSEALFLHFADLVASGRSMEQAILTITEGPTRLDEGREWKMGKVEVEATRVGLRLKLLEKWTKVKCDWTDPE